jgi:hypothetical protein
MDQIRTFLEKRDTSFISEYNGTGATGEPEYWANWNDEYIISSCSNSKFRLYSTDKLHKRSTTF